MNDAGDDGVRARLWFASLAILTSTGLLAELFLTEHTGTPVQWVPIISCALVGVLALAALALRQSASGRIRIMIRFGALAVVGAGAFGVWNHLSENFAFAMEIRPTATAAEALWAAIHGPNPPLASGAVSLAGLLVWGAAPRGVSRLADES